MIIYEIKGETEETKSYDPATFILLKDGSVFSENRVCGFIPRTEQEGWNKERLFDHLERMKKEGFTVTKHTTVTH